MKQNFNKYIVLAALLFALGGLKVLLFIDLASFVFAFLILLLVIRIPEDRSGNDSFALSIVNALMGIGGIAGGLIVATRRFSKNNVKMIYVSAMLSFLLGDVMMGAGRNVIFWAIAGFAASFPIPFINAGQNVILYQRVPEQIQGRVFAVRNAIQFSTIPLGILLGGFLADYIFEPFMMSKNAVSSVLHVLVGQGAGSGMAVMFLCTGVLGCLFSLVSYRQKEIQKLS